MKEPARSFNARVYDIVRRIPEGMVMSYGRIARLAGNARASRAVGYALHGNPDPENIPCHRVIFKDGALCSGFVFGGENRQRELLEAEGVTFTSEGKVDMEKHAWQARELEAEFL